MGGWSEWKEDERIILSPYVDWEWELYDQLQDPLDRWDRFQMVPALGDLGAVNSKAFRFNARSILPEMFTSAGPGVTSSFLRAGRSVAEEPGARFSVFPCPILSVNERYLEQKFLTEAGEAAELGWLDDQDLGVELEPNDIVVGIVDIDIGIGHSRFRNKDGSTRVLASWQQGARWRGPGETDYLPFGQELNNEQINALLEKHSGPHAFEGFDQQGFYSEVGLLAPHKEVRLGSLAGRTAHGTHVMGLLAGADPSDPKAAEFMKRVKLLVVNLPSPVFFGQGGAFLDYYISYGLDWIRETYLKLIKSFGEDARSNGDVPRLVTNISFGKLAGAGDRSQHLVDIIRGDPVHRKEAVFMPAGNDNLERCHAEMRLEQDEQEVAWRIQPDDETSNFLEVWTDETFTEKEIDAFGGRVPLLLDVVLPGCLKEEWSGAQQNLEAHLPPLRRDLLDAEGRIYLEWVEISKGSKPEKSTDTHKKVAIYRLRYLVCLTADTQGLKGSNSAPAGRYLVRVKRNQEAYDALTDKKRDLTARLLIQTDSATLPYKRLARRSYFEDPDYVRFDEEIQPADALALSEAEGRKNKSVIRQQGTMNSYAVNPAVEAIAGYRHSDGEPAPYSATGRRLATERGSDVGPNPDNAVRPKAALPSDDGYAHFGVLSDGAQDGSKIALRGTSFASASAARQMIEAILNGTIGASSNFEGFLGTLSPSNNEKSAWRRKNISQPTKIGEGRIKATAHMKVSRL